MNEIRKLRKLFAIYDRKKMAYLTIIEKTNTPVAIRDFKIIVNAKDGLIKHYPEDYKLDYLGSFDEETGELISNLTTVCEAKEVLENKNE